KPSPTPLAERVRTLSSFAMAAQSPRPKMHNMFYRGHAASMVSTAHPPWNDFRSKLPLRTKCANSSPFGLVTDQFGRPSDTTDLTHPPSKVVFTYRPDASASVPSSQALAGRLHFAPENVDSWAQCLVFHLRASPTCLLKALRSLYVRDCFSCVE